MDYYPYLLGIDQGYTKTRLALISRNDETIYTDEEETSFDSVPFVIKPNNKLIHLRYQERFKSILNRLKILSDMEVAVYYSTNGGLSGHYVSSQLERKGLKIVNFEEFNDSHGHYGLTEMPGRCITYVCGSYYNLMYYDKYNNVTCLPDQFWDAMSWGNGLCAYLIGQLILDTYAESCLENINSELTHIIESRFGSRNNKSVYQYIKEIRLKYDRGCIMQLAPLVSRFRYLERISQYLEREIDNSLLAIRILGDHANDAEIKTVYLGGPVFNNNQFLIDKFRKKALNINLESTEGNTALGAIYFRLRNLDAEIATSQPKPY